MSNSTQCRFVPHFLRPQQCFFQRSRRMYLFQLIELFLFLSRQMWVFFLVQEWGLGNAKGWLAWDLNYRTHYRKFVNYFLITVVNVPLICLWCLTKRLASLAGVSPCITVSFTSNKPDRGWGLTKLMETPGSWRKVIWGEPGTQSSLIFSSAVGSSEKRTFNPSNCSQPESRSMN